MKIQLVTVRHESAVAAIPTAEGPESILDAGLAKRLEGRGCDVRVVDVPTPSPGPVGEIGKSFAVAAEITVLVRDSLEENRLPVVLSGSCHTALGSVSGLPAGRRGVVWLDAHGDFNTPETTSSGLLDGTTLATITGRCWARLRSTIPGFEPIPDEAVLMIGARDLDPEEGERLRSCGIRRLSAEALGDDAAGAEEALRDLRKSVDALYVHLDLDVLDPRAGRANRWAVPEGLTRDGLRSVLTALQRRFPVRALALTSYDPRVDASGDVKDAALDAVEAFTVGADS